MVNPDSDVFREHPDWILQVGDRLPLEHRNQQVLDLTRPRCGRTCATRIDAVLSAHDIGFVKWDHNRDLLEAGSNAARRPGRRARAERGVPAAARRPARAAPAGRVGVLRVRRRAHRSRRGRARAAVLDLGHDRRAVAPADPALDGAADRAGVPRRAHLVADLAPDRAHPVPGLPRGHRAVRLVRHRVGHHRRGRGRPGAAGVLDRAVQAVPAAAAHRPGGPPRRRRPGRARARRGLGGRPRGAARARPAGGVGVQPRRRAAGAGPAARRRSTTWRGRGRSSTGRTRTPRRSPSTARRVVRR